MKLSFLYLLTCVAWCRAAVDLTLQPYSTGADVVEAAVAIIQEKCVFEDDAQMLRRWAKASSDDGQALSGNFTGGIWQMTPMQYLATKNANSSLLTSIQNEYGIDWAATTFQELSKPLYSALAARLSITMVYKGLSAQASVWSSFTGFPTSQYINASNSISSICDAAADIVFLVDGSGSIDTSSFTKTKNFISNLIPHLNVASNKTRVGIVVFSSYVYLQFNLSQHLNENEVVNAVSTLYHPRGGTNTYLGLDYVREYMFTEESGGRKGAPDIVLTITDGQSGSSSATISSANKLINTGVKSFAIGVGYNLRMSELQAIASDRDCNYLTILEGFDEFSAVASQIEKRVCEVKTQVINGTEYTINSGGIKFYYYVVNSTCGLLQIDIAEGEAVIYYSSESQPGPAKYDYKEEVTTSTNKKVLLDGSNQLYITVGAVTRTTISFTSYDDQCSCPEDHVPTTMSSFLLSCQPMEDEGIDNAVSGYNCEPNGPRNPCIPYPIVPGKWYYPHENPNKFVQCGIQTCHVMPCPPNLVWDDNILTCLWG